MALSPVAAASIEGADARGRRAVGRDLHHVRIHDPVEIVLLPRAEVRVRRTARAAHLVEGIAVFHRRAAADGRAVVGVPEARVIEPEIVPDLVAAHAEIPLRIRQPRAARADVGDAAEAHVGLVARDHDLVGVVRVVEARRRRRRARRGEHRAEAGVARVAVRQAQRRSEVRAAPSAVHVILPNDISAQCVTTCCRSAWSASRRSPPGRARPGNPRG